MLDRALVVDEQFTKKVKKGALPSPKGGILPLNVDASVLISWFDAEVKSRHLDLYARILKDKGEAFYTIGSSGHEGNAVLGSIFQPKDLLFLHYRSGALFIERAKKYPKVDGVKSVLLSLMARRDDPISRGRHKVFGSKEMNIPPQTSTIASHLPKALGTALSITRAIELQIEAKLDADSVVMCSFGDASINHASAQTTLNACSWIRAAQYPLPLVFVCEDNGMGISVPTPSAWIKESVIDRLGIDYFNANGLDVLDTFQVASEAIETARLKKKPVFLHLKCVRLLGHAGSDIESQYLSNQTIEATEAHDPLLYTANTILHHQIMSASEIIAFYNGIREEIHALASELTPCAKLSSATEVMDSILPRAKRSVSYLPPSDGQRKKLFKEQYSQLTMARTLQQQINLALTDLLAQYPQLVMFGEDVGKKGGVYRVTAGLQEKFGARRVFDTLLDETTILGTAIGMAHNGFLPMPEIQFLAYFHNAEDQLRGEAATLSFFSDGQFTNPMVIRIASLAYQKGFGGHFHNDNSIAALRDIPGIIIACPSNGADAVMMLRQCVKTAYEKGQVVVFLEPIALYMTKDLHKPKDNEWLSVYPPLNDIIEVGEVGSYGDGELVILSYGNGYYLSRQAEKRLKDEHGIAVKLVDMRWLKPLPTQAILKEVKNAKAILIVDECRKTGSLSEAVVTCLVEGLESRPFIKRITGEDSFIPLGDAWKYVLPSTQQIVDTVVEMFNTKENSGGRFSIT